MSQTDAVGEPGYTCHPLYGKPLLIDELHSKLTNENISQMAFLILKYCPSWLVLRSMKPREFLELLVKHFNLAACCVLEELLYIIQKFNLLRFLNSCPHLARIRLEQHFAFVDSQQRLLYHICDNLDDTELSNLSKLLSHHYPAMRGHAFQMGEDLMVYLQQNNLLPDCLEKTFLVIFRNMEREDLVECITRHKESLSQELPLYPVRRATPNSPCGLAIIINQIHFEGAIDRWSSEVDTEKLQRVWENFGFEVRPPYTDLKGDEIRAILKNTAETINSFYDIFVCCILSHGKKQNIYGTDMELVDINEILSYFGVNCPNLQGKPKLFFIQACQGLDGLGGYTDSKTCDTREVKAPSAASEIIPQQAYYQDLLVVHSTIPGHVSFLTSEGSWFIQSLVRNIEKYGDTTSFVDILSHVNYDLGQLTASHNGCHAKQIPHPTSLLSKKLILKRRTD